jgi:hypothetical protein
MNRLYCRKHVDHYRRHGSYFKRSYSAGELRLYRRAALDWLRTNSSDPAVSLAIARVTRLYASAGPLVPAFRLGGRSPQERAQAAWARLREARVDPVLPLAAWLAIDMKLRDDPQADRSTEYRHVQVAKLVHRMASGTHKQWQQETANGKVRILQLHKYPISRGLVLRHIAQSIDRAAKGLSFVVSNNYAA